MEAIDLQLWCRDPASQRWASNRLTRVRELWIAMRRAGFQSAVLDGV
jgi:hypothetical protein